MGRKRCKRWGRGALINRRGCRKWLNQCTCLSLRRRCRRALRNRLKGPWLSGRGGLHSRCHNRRRRRNQLNGFAPFGLLKLLFARLILLKLPQELNIQGRRPCRSACLGHLKGKRT